MPLLGRSGGDCAEGVSYYSLAEGVGLRAASK